MRDLATPRHRRRLAASVLGPLAAAAALLLLHLSGLRADPSFAAPAGNQAVAQVPVGASPHHPLVTPSGEYGLVVSQGPGELALLTPGSNAVSATLTVGALPHWIATDADGETAYVTNEGSDDVSVVDLKRQQ